MWLAAFQEIKKLEFLFLFFFFRFFLHIFGFTCFLHFYYRAVTSSWALHLAIFSSRSYAIHHGTHTQHTQTSFYFLLLFFRLEWKLTNSNFPSSRIKRKIRDKLDNFLRSRLPFLIGQRENTNSTDDIPRWKSRGFFLFKKYKYRTHNLRAVYANDDLAQLLQGYQLERSGRSHHRANR